MKKQLTQYIKARTDFIEAVNNFPVKKRDDLLFGSWNLKDVISHYSAWDIFFTNCIKALKKEKETPYWRNIDDFNNVEIEKRKKWTWDQAYHELLEAEESFIKEMENLPSDMFDKKIWKKKKYTPLKLLEINIHHYQKAQYQEINKLLKKWQ